jgi:hypothetical protein
VRGDEEVRAEPRVELEEMTLVVKCVKDEESALLVVDDLGHEASLGRILQGCLMESECLADHRQVVGQGLGKIHPQEAVVPGYQRRQVCGRLVLDAPGGGNPANFHRASLLKRPPLPGVLPRGSRNSRI